MNQEGDPPVDKGVAETKDHWNVCVLLKKEILFLILVDYYHVI